MSVRAVYSYEVVLRVATRGEPAEYITRLEQAYSPVDAVMQASMTVSSQRPHSVLTLERVGPPLDVIAAQESALHDSAIGTAIKRLFNTTK